MTSTPDQLFPKIPRRSFLGWGLLPVTMAMGMGLLTTAEAAPESYHQLVGDAEPPLDSPFCPAKLWGELLNFRPPELIQQQILGKVQLQLQFLGRGPKHVGWFVQRIEDGTWDVCADFYPVHIRRLPRNQNGNEISIQSLVQFVKLHLNELGNPRVTLFEPYDYTTPSRNVTLGGALYLRLGTDFLAPTKAPGGFYTISPEACTVVVTEQTDLGWKFSTTYANGHRYLQDDRTNHSQTPRVQPANGGYYHPVSGTRGFGAYRHPKEGWVFYTAGMDRLSRWSFIPEFIRKFLVGTRLEREMDFTKGYWESIVSSYFQNHLWLSLQRNLVDYINKTGGLAEIPVHNGKPISIARQHHWPSLVAEGVFHPQTRWVDEYGEGRYLADRAPTHDSALVEIATAMEQIDGRNVNDPPRLFDRPFWMQALQSKLPHSVINPRQSPSPSNDRPQNSQPRPTSGLKRLVPQPSSSP